MSTPMMFIIYVSGGQYVVFYDVVVVAGEQSIVLVSAADGHHQVEDSVLQVLHAVVC
jgi:hypothetical protein